MFPARNDDYHRAHSSSRGSSSWLASFPDQPPDRLQCVPTSPASTLHCLPSTENTYIALPIQRYLTSPPPQVSSSYRRRHSLPPTLLLSQPDVQRSPLDSRPLRLSLSSRPAISASGGRLRSKSSSLPPLHANLGEASNWTSDRRSASPTFARQMSHAPHNEGQGGKKGKARDEGDQPRWNDREIAVNLPPERYSPPDTPIDMRMQRFRHAQAQRVMDEDDRLQISVFDTRPRKERYPWPEKKVESTGRDVPFLAAHDGTFRREGARRNRFLRKEHDESDRRAEGDLRSTPRWKGKEVLVSLPDLVSLTDHIVQKR